MKKNNQQLIFGIHACIAALMNSKELSIKLSVQNVKNIKFN